MLANMLDFKKTMLTPDKFNTANAPPATLARIEEQLRAVLKNQNQLAGRLRRMESRLCQLMIDQGSEIHLPEPLAFPTLDLDEM